MALEGPHLDDRWSFGGAAAIETPAGLLRPVGLVVGPDHAVMDCWLTAAPGWGRTDMDAALAALSAEHQKLGFEDLVIIDDRGTRYTPRVGSLMFGPEQNREPIDLPLRLDPIPARECEWLELRNQAGATTRLPRSTRPTVRVGEPISPPESPAERELPEPAVQRTDGPPLQFDIAAVLPVRGVTVRIDCLISGPDSWRLHLRAIPGWWVHSADGRGKRAALSVVAVDDIGGRYASSFGGSTGHGDHEELALRFLPRLDPLARTLTLTCRGTDDEVTVELGTGRSG